MMFVALESEKISSILETEKEKKHGYSCESLFLLFCLFKKNKNEESLFSYDVKWEFHTHIQIWYFSGFQEGHEVLF